MNGQLRSRKSLLILEAPQRPPEPLDSCQIGRRAQFGFCVNSFQVWQFVSLDPKRNRPSLSGSAGDKPVLLERHDHLVDRGWGHLKVPLHVSFRRRLAIELGVVVDKRQVLALLLGGSHGDKSIPRTMKCVAVSLSGPMTLQIIRKRSHGGSDCEPRWAAA